MGKMKKTAHNVIALLSELLIAIKIVDKGSVLEFTKGMREFLNLKVLPALPRSYIRMKSTSIEAVNKNNRLFLRFHFFLTL